MVLGLMYGQFNKDDIESLMRANKVNVEMMNGFADKSGSYICNELLGCDIRMEEGSEDTSGCRGALGAAY